MLLEMDMCCPETSWAKKSQFGFKKMYSKTTSPAEDIFFAKPNGLYKAVNSGNTDRMSIDILVLLPVTQTCQDSNQIETFPDESDALGKFQFVHACIWRMGEKNVHEVEIFKISGNANLIKDERNFG